MEEEEFIDDFGNDAFEEHNEESPSANQYEAEENDTFVNNNDNNYLDSTAEPEHQDNNSANENSNTNQEEYNPSSQDSVHNTIDPLESPKAVENMYYSKNSETFKSTSANSKSRKNSVRSHYSEHKNQQIDSNRQATNNNTSFSTSYQPSGGNSSRQPESFSTFLQQYSGPAQSHNISHLTNVDVDDSLVTHYADSAAVSPQKEGDTDKDVIIRKLKKANKVLQQQLIELSSVLDARLEEKGVKLQSHVKAPRTFGVPGDKEMKNILKQNEFYKKENEELKKLAFATNSSINASRLENLVKEKSIQIDSLVEENKGLVNQVREQSKALERLSLGPNKAIEMLMTENKYLKEALKQQKDKNAQLNETNRQINEQILHLRLKMEKYETILKDKAMNVNSIAHVKKLEEELESKSKELEMLRKESETEKHSLVSKLKMLKTDLYAKDVELKLIKEENESVLLNVSEQERERRAALLQQRKQEKMKQREAKMQEEEEAKTDKKESAIVSGRKNSKVAVANSKNAPSTKPSEPKPATINNNSNASNSKQTEVQNNSVDEKKIIPPVSNVEEHIEDDFDDIEDPAEDNAVIASPTPQPNIFNDEDVIDDVPEEEPVDPYKPF